MMTFLTLSNPLKALYFNLCLLGFMVIALNVDQPGIHDPQIQNRRLQMAQVNQNSEFAVSQSIEGAEDRVASLPVVLPPALSKVTGKTFKIFSGGQSWFQARGECFKKGGRLATPENKSENDQIWKIVGSRHAWIGVNDIEAEKKWRTVDGRLVTFTFWAPGEPNNWRNEDCAEMYGDHSGQWNDNECSRNCKHYVCEFGFKKNASNKRFQFFGRSTTWNDARKDCQKRGGDLAKINNLMENYEVLNLIGGAHAWISPNDRKKERKWKNADGSDLKFTHWAPREPNNWYNEDCGEIYGNHSGQWNDNRCSAKRSYVCQFSKVDEKYVFKNFDLKGNFRTIDGSKNNKKNPTWGKSFTNRIRLAPQDLPEHRMANSGLPSPRAISNEIHNQKSKHHPKNPHNLSSWMWAFGQYVDHDLAADPELDAAVGDIVCAHNSCSAPIDVPKDDPYFGKFGLRKMSFHRTPYKLGDNSFASNKFERQDRKFYKERKYPNVITHWIDLSSDYGSTDKRSKELRDLTPSGHGRLRTDPSGNFPHAKMNTSRNKLQFEVGDVRGNENLVLMSVHILFLKEHNRIADLLWKERGSPKNCDRKCNDEIFEHARAYSIGLFQKITYEEWLPEFLGPEFFDKHVGKYKGYNPNLDPSVSSEFTVAAYRVGHSFVNNELWRITEDGKPAPGGHLPLKDAFFLDAKNLMNVPDEVKFVLLGLGAQKAEAQDALVVDALRNMLFGQGEAGMDLTARNAQRGRDDGNSKFARVKHYLCKYTLKVSVKDCPPFNSFDDFHVSPAIQHKLRKLYKKPQDVELFVAGLLEKPAPGGRIGETFSLIIADQFKRVRDGDRFWYENNYLPQKMVDHIKNQNLAKVIQRNLNVRLSQTQIEQNVFKVVQ